MSILFGAAVFLAAVLLGARPALRWVIRRRLQGYRVAVTRPDAKLPERLSTSCRVAVVGGGLAGLAAASTLAERGFAVTLFEAKGHLGGKIGAWRASLPSGEEVWVSHGFHAFFRHYYNLNSWLERLGLLRGFRAIDDYLILSQTGEETRFRDLERTPALNLVALAFRGVYRFREVLFGPARDLMGVFLEYDEATTFARLDRYSLADFDRLAALPPGLKLSFRTFARAFFAEEDKVSLAELVKSFHFYYLSHDHGLIYDYPEREYEVALLAPIRRHLESLGVELRLSTPVQTLVRNEQGTLVNGEAFDKLVVAADAAAANRLLSTAQGFPAGPWQAQLAELRAGQRYAVLRLFLDRDVRAGLPYFVVTDRLRLLDAVTLYHRLEQESAEWVQRRGGGAVIELHSYAVPDALADEEVKPALIQELLHFFPELQGFELLGEVFQLPRDFTAFHRGLFAARPPSDSGVKGLWFAGDWVKLPFPAMLLEAAFSSGLVAANGILAEEGLSPAPIDSVPPRGLMAGMPEPPARKKLLG